MLNWESMGPADPSLQLTNRRGADDTAEAMLNEKLNQTPQILSLPFFFFYDFFYYFNELFILF